MVALAAVHAEVVTSAATACSDEQKNCELLFRMSAILEDDPEMAAAFSRSLALDPDLVQVLQAVCEEGEHAEILNPTDRQLKQAFVAAGLPFLGFGFLDNAVMIAFGDVIDATLCTSLGFSTMAAAALGNTLSDGVGVFSGGMVEDAATRAGFEAPPLSKGQQALPLTRHWERLGQLFGITVGCLLGMFPLLLIKSDHEDLKRDKLLESVHEHVVLAVEEMLGAEAAMIMLVDGDKQELYSRTTAAHGPDGGPTTNDFAFRAAFGEGVLGRVAQTGAFLNIADLRSAEGKEYYVPEIHDDFRGTGIRVRSVLCMPVFGYNEATGRCDRVVGVVGVVNKRAGGQFTEWDEDALAALCSHVSTSLSFIHGEEHGFDEALDRCKQALSAKGTRINPAQTQRLHDMYSAVLAEVCRTMGVSFAQLLAVDGPKEVRVIATSADGGERQAHAPNRTQCLHRSSAVHVSIEKRGTHVAEEGHYASTMCCPLFSQQDKLIGVIRVAGHAGRCFSPDDVQALEDVARNLQLTMDGAGANLAHTLRLLRETPAGCDPGAQQAE